MQIQEYEFTLVLGGALELSDEVVNRFFEASAGDAAIGKTDGQIEATFCRRAATLFDAVYSAQRDVLAAGIGAVIRGLKLPEGVTL